MVVTLAVVMVMGSSITATAAEWKQDGTTWRYQEDDGSYTANGWKWVNEKCYYFDVNGIMLANCVTPDGYTVDENGAWLVDVPQVQVDVQNANNSVISDVQLGQGSEYVGEVEGYIYVSGYGYVKVSQNGAAVEGNHPTSYDDLVDSWSGTMG